LFIFAAVNQTKQSDRTKSLNNCTHVP